MKTMALPALAMATLMSAQPVSTPSGPRPGKQTLEDLNAAMRGEAFAHAKYMLFAKHARLEGREELARLFESAATKEHLEHFAELAKLAGLEGTDPDNLRNAIHGETYETTTMYPEFARKAAASGDKDAAQRFEEIARDEQKHREAFQAALNQLEKKGR
jgi:rubrerythrin